MLMDDDFVDEVQVQGTLFHLCVTKDFTEIEKIPSQQIR